MVVISICEFFLSGDYYAGTEFDLSQGMLAGPWGTPYRLEGGKAFFGQIPRGISIPRTSYSFLGQPKANVKDSVGWYDTLVCSSRGDSFLGLPWISP